jgi:hypothetical protein
MDIGPRKDNTNMAPFLPTKDKQALAALGHTMQLLKNKYCFSSYQ